MVLRGCVEEVGECARWSNNWARVQMQRGEGKSALGLERRNGGEAEKRHGAIAIASGACS